MPVGPSVIGKVFRLRLWFWYYYLRLTARFSLGCYRLNTWKQVGLKNESFGTGSNRQILATAKQGDIEHPRRISHARIIRRAKRENQ